MKQQEHRHKLFKGSQICIGLVSIGLFLFSTTILASDSKKQKIYIMHTGDLHGDLQSHSNDRADANGLLEGGLARVATIVKKMRKRYGDKLVWGHTGDTTSGSAIATYTQGKALVDVWDSLGPDVFAPGNWEYAYGIYRYQQLWGSDGDISAIADADLAKMAIPPFDPSGKIYAGLSPDSAFKTDQNGENRRWASISANAYYNGQDVGPGVQAKTAGELLTDPYLVKTVNGVRIGFIGCTTNRGPQVVSSNVTKGISFTNCMGTVKFPQNKTIQWPTDHPNRDAAAETSVKDGSGKEIPQWGSTVGYRTVPEIVKFTHILRLPEGSDSPYLNSATGKPWKGEGVDMVVLMSEAGIPENVWNAERTIMPEGIAFPEVVLSSDTHEKTTLPVAVTTPTGAKTILVEQGEDGAQVTLLKLTLVDGQLKKWKSETFAIDERIKEDKKTAKLIDRVEEPFNHDDFDADKWINPYNGYKLTVPLDYQMASTEIVMERNRFSHEHDPDNLKMPAVVEGTLHDVYVDAFRALTGADVGGIRGFRYTNTIMPGPITVGDIYHSLSIGAMIAVGAIPATPEAEHGADPADPGKCIFDKDNPDRVKHQINKCHGMAWPRNLIQEVELSGNSTQQTTIPNWGGGWIWNYSGLNFDLDAYQGNFDKYGTKLRSRVSNATLVDAAGAEIGPLSARKNVMYASYYFDADFNRINRNQLETKGSCKKKGFSGLTRECIGDKIRILAKTGTDFGAPMVLVTPLQFAAKSVTIGDRVFTIYPMDVVEAVGRYINEAEIVVKDLSNGTVISDARIGLGGSVTVKNFAPTFPRINLVRQLRSGLNEFGFGVIQPFRGALAPADQTHFADTPKDEGRF
ncbi:MAG: metallophosphoesterase [Thiohalomonadales bacterium]